MCGIAGIINFKKQKTNSGIITDMMDQIRHRGPDDDGMYIENGIALGFVRLSILDLSNAGHQPMHDSSGRYTIIHNGEVYNYIEIREILEQKGYDFKSKTDTEVILNSYIEWGENCLDKFNGMWAFCIYDNLKKEVFLSRDRFGVKPFYYFKNKDYFIFASEIKPILIAIKELELADNIDANYQSIFDYLVFNRTDQTQETFFKNIFKLQHGNFLKINIESSKNERFYFNQWYNVSEAVKQAEPFKRPEEFTNSFLESLKLRLRSDVPIGVCLSGGLDSSSIVSTLVDKYELKELHTFSAVYNKDDYGDESEFINEYKAILNNMHFTSPSSDTLYSDLEKFVDAHAEPVPSASPYAQFKVMELAKKNAVVTLDGQGADEILAGYHYFYGFYFKELFWKSRFLKLLKEVYFYLKIHKSLYGVKSLFYFMLPDFIKTNYRTDKASFLIKNFSDKYKNNNNVTKNIYASKNLNDALIDHINYKLEHLLKWEDRNSMYFSLESRVPFLDYRLVEGTIASLSSFKIKNGVTKYILRESMLGILPNKIRNRVDKIGFGTPSSKWFLEQRFEDYFFRLHNQNNKIQSIVDTNKVKEIFRVHRDGKKDFSKEIWKLINLSIWFKKFDSYIK